MKSQMVLLPLLCFIALNFFLWYTAEGKKRVVAMTGKKSLTILASDTRAYGKYGRNQSVCETMLEAKGGVVEIVYYLQNTCSDTNVGNKLSRLYMSNTMAMAIGAEFLYVCPTHKDTENNRSFMSRLARVRMDSSSNIRHVAPKLKSLEDICAACDSNHPHKCPSGEIGTVLPIIIEDLQRISRHASDYHENSFDVALHYRCGDILGLHTEKYGLLPHSTFLRLIEARHDREDNISIIILNGKKSTRPRDVMYTETCKTIVTDLIYYLNQNFPNARISAPNNGSIAVDYIRLIRAKSMAICGSSTFCLWPSLANPNSRIYNSRLFPWINTLHGNSTVFNSIMLKPRRNQTILEMGVESILAWLQTN